MQEILAILVADCWFTVVTGLSLVYWESFLVLKKIKRSMLYCMSSISNYDRLDDLSRFNILDALNAREKGLMRRVCRQFDTDVKYHNPMQYGLSESFMAEMGEGSQRENLDARLQRSYSLIKAAKQLPGGHRALDQITDGGNISLADPASVSGAIHYLKECEAVGLIALLQQIPETGPLLQSLKELPPSSKSEWMERWMRENEHQCKRITLLEVVNYKKARLADVHNLKIEGVQNKVLNCLPKGIGNLSHLEILNVQNNLLNMLPLEVGKLPLREINLSQNQFKEFPEILGRMATLTHLNLSSNRLVSPDFSPFCGMKQLKHLDLSQNQLAVLSSHFSTLSSLETLDLRGNPFSTAELEKFISHLPQSRLKIRVDSRHRLEALMEQIRLQGDYTLNCSVGIGHLCYTLWKRDSQSPITPQMMEDDD